MIELLNVLSVNIFFLCIIHRASLFAVTLVHKEDWQELTLSHVSVLYNVILHLFTLLHPPC